jgi:hypothetical protein
MTIDTIRERAEAFDRRGWRQDAASMAAFALIVVANAIAIGFETSVVEKLGDGLSIAASMYVLRYYWRVREANPAVKSCAARRWVATSGPGWPCCLGQASFCPWRPAWLGRSRCRVT